MASTLIQIDITYITQKPMKGALVDHLVENLVEDYEPMADFFLDESILSIETQEDTLVGVNLMGQ